MPVLGSSPTGATINNLKIIKEMIEAVIKQDLESINDLLRTLAEKYDQDFYFVGGYGIKGDKSQDDLPIYSNVSIIGVKTDICFGLHNLLNSELGAAVVLDALICHCNMEIPAKSKVQGLARELFLSEIKSELINKIKSKDADKAVQELLKNSGF